ncbi:lipopolysaccharide transport periplasmic protein LptA [Pseudidiomarina sp.]|uniref:lipopolysaccharide transport periplasmic protein LptA n=1 Tax=Pseudidiomarina sp. TaxID=2081707 RepID=UPI00299E5E59|nr:lipopolysaccharide transport periplasmic protein LptA [Pseudidiomarina sp.]MDX1705195.1 lipopolysaccharide transport periplasmic protein LptA [Pseudidiomarina sp.]
MHKRFILVSVSLTISALLAPFNALAQGKEDFSKPIEINAENDFFDIANKVAVFDTNVQIRQGTLEINADHLEVSRDVDDPSDLFIASGSPATYQQRLDDGSLITAEAEKIRYDQEQQTMTLSGNVKVSQNNSVIQGNEIVYNFATQQLSARRGEDESDRVTTIFLPKKSDNEPINR